MASRLPVEFLPGKRTNLGRPNHLTTRAAFLGLRCAQGGSLSSHPFAILGEFQSEITFEEVVALLEAEAERLERLKDGEVRLMVKWLDLRLRL